MKFLNLDALAKTTRTITLGGKDHEVVEMTVEGFIETTKAAENLSKNPTFEEQVDRSIEMIQRSVPTLDRATLLKLSMEQMAVVLRFLRGELDDEAKTGKSEGSAQGK